jgi:exodeoxyribonuclease-5
MDGDFKFRSVEWSAEQLEALRLIFDWYERGEHQVFYLSGYAGTGKTTLAREIGRRVGGNVIFTSFTGRACAVMARKGCDPVDTIDALIYRRSRSIHCAKDPSFEKVCGDRCPYKRERFGEKVLNLESPVATAGLVIADEVSMLGSALARDLLSFGRKTLVLGDIGQLPAVWTPRISGTANPTGTCRKSTGRQPDRRSSGWRREREGVCRCRCASTAKVRSSMILRMTH